MGLLHVLYLCETAAAAEGCEWPPSQVLDYGCGGGSNILALRALGCEWVVGYDVTPDRFGWIVEHSDGGGSVVLTADGAGLRSRSFQAAICTSVLQHCDPVESRRILREIAARLYKHGLALLQTRRPEHGVPAGSVDVMTAWGVQDAQRD